MSDNAPVADLKARLSRYLRRVKGGHEVIVTDRGVPVAKLVPLTRSQQREGRRARLARAGVLQLGSGRISKALRKPPKGMPIGAAVLRSLLADRRESR